jgi:HSP20 family protein
MLPALSRNGLGRQSLAWPRWANELDQWIGGSAMNAGAMTFPVDIRTEGEKTILEADLPGVARENIDITVEDNVLTIATHYQEQKEEGSTEVAYHVQERRRGEFSRSFRLPKDADSEHVEARFENGVLTVQVPTREEAKPRKVQLS